MPISKTHSLITMAGFATLFAAPGIRADEIIHTASIPLQQPDWNETLNIPLFDPSLGTLENIMFTLSGEMQSLFFLESLTPTPATFTVTASGIFTLSRPNMTTLIEVQPSASESRDLSAFDGNVDFEGTSGAIIGPIIASETERFTSSPPASDLMLFTGAGSIGLPISATGNSFVTGPGGGPIIVINSEAAATLSVKYTYNPLNAVPEPGNIALLIAAGITGAGWLRRRTR